MTGFEAFNLYQAIKLHFTSKSYDYFKYGGRTNFKPEHFENRKDKYHFLKLSRKYNNQHDLIMLLVSVFLEKDKVWVGELFSPESFDLFQEKQKTLQSLGYIFENEMQKIFSGVDNPVSVLKTDGGYPILLEMVMRKEISLETLCIMDKVCNFMETWNEKIEDDIVWPRYYNRIKKYQPFLAVDTEKYQKIIVKHIHEKMEDDYSIQFFRGLKS